MCWKSTLILFCHPHFDFPVSLFSSDFGTNVFWIVLLLLECCVSHVSHHPQFHHSFKLSWTIRIWISSSCYFLHVIFESLKDKYVHVHVFIIFWKKKSTPFFGYIWIIHWSYDFLNPLLNDNNGLSINMSLTARHWNKHQIMCSPSPC